MILKIRQLLGLESPEEQIERYEDVQKSFDESDATIDELAKDYFIEKSYYEQRMKDPDNLTIQNRIQEKFDNFIKYHKENIRKAKRNFDSLKKEREAIEKSLKSHKYIRKEWKDGEWKYIYDQPENKEDGAKRLSQEEKYRGDKNSEGVSETSSNIRTEESTSGVSENKEQIESQTERFGLKETNNITDLKDNIKEILSQYSNRDMANIQVEKYLNENKTIAQEYLKENNIKSREDFAKHTRSLQNKAREGKGKERREILNNWKKEKENKNLNAIIDFALQQEDEWQERIKKEDAYSKIKKAYQNNQISLDSFNSIIKGITKEEKTKYADFILLNEKGELLLLKRSQWEEDNKGAWVIPGGHVDPGEDFKTAAIRELREESGYNVDKCENVGSYEDDKCHIEYFQASINNNEQSILLDWMEVRDYKWMKPEDLKDEWTAIFNMKENVMKIMGIDKWRHKEVIRKAIMAGIIPLEQIIEKAWKKSPIGTIATRKDGKKYKKVSETGNSKADWKLVTQDKGSKQDENSANKDAKSENNTNTQPTEKELKEHAKTTSEQALENAIKQSPDPEVRQTAHEELKRREEEEKPAEEDEKKKEGKDKKEAETTKDKKSSSLSDVVEELSDKYKDIVQ